MNEKKLIARLVEAARAGECPLRDCSICKEKRQTILDAEHYLVMEGDGDDQD